MLRKRRVGLPAPDRLIGGPTILRDQPEETRPQAKPSPLSWRSLGAAPASASWNSRARVDVLRIRSQTSTPRVRGLLAIAHSA